MKQPLSFKVSMLFASIFINTTYLTTRATTNCSTHSKTTWLPRSFVSYQEHDLINNKLFFLQDAYSIDNPKIHTSFFTEYMQSFENGNGCKNLGAMPFWSGNNTLTIGNNDGRAQLDAYQMGLGNVTTNDDGIAGTIQLNPKIQHFGTDMLFQYTHNPHERGFYIKIHAPLGAMKITPHLTTTLQAQPDDALNFTQTTANPASSSITYQFLHYPVPA